MSQPGPRFTYADYGWPQRRDAPVLSREYFPGSARWLVLYDGHCPLCRRSVGWLQQRDRHGALHCLPLQTAGLLDAAGIALAEAMAGVQVLSRSGLRYQGADGILHAMASLPGWGWLRWAFAIPGFLPIARRVYRYIAKRRTRDEPCDGACNWHQ